MKKRTMKPKNSGQDERGFAIILTLLVITMLTVLVIGFNAATRTEQMAARNFSYQESAGQMATLAVNRAIALLNTNITNGTLTQPGRSWSPDAGNVMLTSAGAGPSTVSTNINTWQAGVGDMQGRPATNYFIATNTNSGFFSVPLVDVRVSNVLVGRFGFWIDDDSSRMNLNAAIPLPGRTNFLPTNARPLLLANNTISPNFTRNPAVFNSLISPGTTPNRLNGWGYFFTPRQIILLPSAPGTLPPSDRAITSFIYNSMMWQVGAGPLNRPSNSYVLALSNNPAFLDVGGVNGFLSVYGSAGYTNGLTNLLGALDKVTTNYLSGANYAKYFGPTAVSGLAGKYTTNVMRQIIANINDAILPNTDTSFVGANVGTMLSPATNGSTPLQVFGIRPAPFLNEVAVGAAFHTNSSPGRLEVQIWMQSELVDPYRSGEGINYQIKYKVNNLKFAGTFQTNGTTQAFSNPPTSETWNFDGSNRLVTVSSNVVANGFLLPSDAFVFEWQVTGSAGANIPIPANASNFTLSTVTVTPGFAILRKTNSPGSIRDWASDRDFTNALTYSNIPVSSISFGNNGYKATNAALAPGGAAFFSQGIAKNDPRVRRFGTNNPPSVPWIPVSGSGVTLGANNSTVNFNAGTGIANLNNDKPGSATDIYSHPSFSTGTGINTRVIPAWLSTFDLSRIHTGLQWRTLQLRSQDASEANASFVPDWAVLETFALAGNPAPALVKLNINSLPYPATTNSSVTNMVTSGLTRAPALSSLLAGNTNSATNASVTVGGTNFSLGIPAAAAIPRTGSGSFLEVATNIATQAFTNSWGTRRAAITAFPTNAYSMVTEVLEINNVSNFSTDEAANEGRARGFYDALTVSSDIFTVYAVGYAMDKNTNVVSETRMRAQVARDPIATNQFQIIMAEPFVWP